MKTMRFTPHRTGAYGCSEPGEQYGEYVKADVARDLLSACKDALEWIRHGRYEVIDDVCDAIAAAIAKAEGRDA